MQKSGSIERASKQSMTVVERVYIGGFDADHLSGEEIVGRLKPQLADSLAIEGDVYYGSCFCHMNVIAKKEGTSGLECISKMYHNVKWKGFKLRVEKARPHFLERLEVERQQRKSVPVRFDHPKANPPLDPPRFFKIKQRYGEECWKVDTRPLEVKDWPRFEKLRRKLTKQQAKSDQQEVSRKPKPAIHFTFAVDLPCEQDMALSQRDVSESETDSSASSVVEGERGKYQWSDDDDESNDSSESSIAAADTSKTPFKEPNMLGEFEPSLDDVSSQISDESDSDSSTSMPHAIDLDGEVERGLTVLSELFPDIKKATPAVVKQTTPSQDDFRTSDVLMERYDPSQASAEKFRLHDDTKMESSAEEMEVQEKEKDLPKDLPSHSCSDVYEEKKLEAVFRQARDATVSTVSSVPVVGLSADSATGNFSFAFQLESEEKAQLPSSTQTFEFAFSVKDDSVPKASIGDKASEHHVDSVDASASVESNAKRRRTMFTSDELSTYVEDFFLMGDGEKIRDDLERYRGDEAIRQRWLQDRKALTLDWKRKRKHAVSRRKNA